MAPLDHGQLNIMLCSLKAGDARALDAIYMTVGGRMFALARGIVHNREDAQDVLSDSFLKIAQNIRKYKEGTNAYAWVMRIVRNTAFDLLRRRKVRAEEDIDEFFHLTDERYSHDRCVNAVALELAVAQLSPEERKLVYYRYYLDFTVREIAKELGMGKSTVQRMLVATEEKLKSLLSEGQIGS